MCERVRDATMALRISREHCKKTGLGVKEILGQIHRRKQIDMGDELAPVKEIENQARDGSGVRQRFQ